MCKKRFAGCPVTCGHRQFVYEYYEERQRQEIDAENDYRNRDGNEHATKIIDFKTYLIATKGRGRLEHLS